MAQSPKTTRAQVGLRVPESLRAKLEKAADVAGNSMNSEILTRVQQSFELEDRLGGPRMVDLIETIASVMKSAGEHAGFYATGKLANEGEWMSVPFAFDQATAAAVAILEYHRPPGEIVQPTPNIVQVVVGGGDRDESVEQIRQMMANLGQMLADYELKKRKHDDE